MKRYYLVEMDGDQFETALKAKDMDDAAEIAAVRWAKMSAYDKKRTKYFYVAECEEITPPEEWDGGSDIDGFQVLIDRDHVYKVLDTRDVMPGV